VLWEGWKVSGKVLTSIVDLINQGSEALRREVIPPEAERTEAGCC
jgi:hypothetical protein